ncbi:MAG: PRC-barrel domain-containing protein [Halobacteria archaeon]|nr:PRC-barrel domain-containing protein [Halobacteria archaeon]
MTQVLARNLIDKKVMGDDGTELGRLTSITCDLGTGRLGDLVLEPTKKGREIYGSGSEDGSIRIPTRRINAVKDVIVVNR